MLINTFQHIQGVGHKAEQALWASGALDWQGFNRIDDIRMTEKKKETIKSCLIESESRLTQNDPAYFTALLSPSLHWRVFPEFRHTTVYLDIETTGLDWQFEEITTIALYDGDTIRYYVKGQNLEAFKTDITKYNLIITYNGKTFDIPFLKHYFGIELDHAHIDLRYVLASLGYKGGLKGCEASLGIDRGDAKGIDGFFAVLLWHDYMKNQNEKALETLLAYNIEDVVNLEQLMLMAYNMKIKETPFLQSHPLALPVPPVIPFHVDRDTVERIKREHMYF